MRTQRSTDNGFRKTIQTKDGRLSLKLSPNIAQRVTRYCEATNQNRTAFVEKIIEKTITELETDMYDRLTKSQLIDLLKERDAQDALKEQMSLFGL